MLMQNFKSAADLGITEPQLSALQKTLVLLETGKLEHSTAFDFDRDFEPASTFSGKFNMRYWAEHGKCGTIACIGGTAELIGGARFDCGARPPGLHDLFQPQKVPIALWKNITTDQAATALRSYLTTGDARWDLAVGS